MKLCFQSPRCGCKIIPSEKEQTKVTLWYHLRLVLEQMKLLQEHRLPLECVLEIDIGKENARAAFLGL